MLRNVYLDLDNILGCNVQAATVVRTTVGAEPVRHMLHCLVEDDAAVADWGAKHARAYEYTDDLPVVLKSPEGKPKHEFLGVPVYKNSNDRLAPA
jgi:hypothetical protein